MLDFFKFQISVGRNGQECRTASSCNISWRSMQDGARRYLWFLKFTSWWKFSPSLKLIRASVTYSYSVIAADTLRDLMTLTFHPLTSISSHTWRVTWSPSVKIQRLSIVEIWVLISPVGYHWQCVWSHCPCTVSRDLCVGGGQSFYLRGRIPLPYPRRREVRGWSQTCCRPASSC